MEQILTVENMSCQHCVARITEKLQALDGVSQVQINLEDKQVQVTTEKNYNQADYQAALAKTIYQVTTVQ